MARRVVLVVEDDAAIRQGIVDALGAAGYEARETVGHTVIYRPKTF